MIYGNELYTPHQAKNLFILIVVHHNYKYWMQAPFVLSHRCIGLLVFPSGLNNGGCHHAIKEPVAVSLEQVNMGGTKTLEWECIRCIQKQRPGVILISQQHLQRIALSQ
jgi:hypothetical protein